MDMVARIFSGFEGVVFGVLGVVTFVAIVALLKATIRVASPDRILVVTGRKTRHQGRSFGFSVDRGRTLVVPYFQAVGTLDLGVFPINVRVEGVNSANGITVGADATACVCIDDDDEAMLYSAVERLMGKDSKQIHDQVQQTLVGNFRGALNKATPLQAIGMEDSLDNVNEGADMGERAQFRGELLEDINSDLRSFGMKVVSVSLQKIWDTSNYIANLAQKTLAEKRRQVEIEESRLRAIADQAESDARRRIEVSRSQADEAIIAARQELEIYRRESAGLIEEARLQADQAIAEARNAGEAAVQAELIELQKLKNASAVTLVAEANEEAARTVADGDRAAVGIRQSARNAVLKAKAELLAGYGDDAASVMFLTQKLPALFEAYRAASSSGAVDSYVVMNDEEGFSGAVNRGPRAFADFLKTFTEAFGIDIRTLAMPVGKGGAK
jgi:regulator of protease activity HflC (stomatin/prohibitin superfamily)